MIADPDDIDFAVAKACGIPTERIGYTSCYRVLAADEPRHNNGYGDPDNVKPFRPSTDLNDAFLAAEKVDLFLRFDLSRTRLRWQIFEFQSSTKYGEPRDDLFASGETAACAICAAILKLKGTA